MLLNYEMAKIIFDFMKQVPYLQLLPTREERQWRGRKDSKVFYLSAQTANCRDLPELL